MSSLGPALSAAAPTTPMTAAPISSPFDAIAEAYDTAFTHTTIGESMRRAVWRRLDAHWSAGATILDINCGTGEDAAHLARRGVRVLATDASAAMVAAARRKAEQAGVHRLVDVRHVPIEELDGLEHAPFDGVLSNFGGLNCVDDLRHTSRTLAGLIKPGGLAVFCVMGPVVPWEWLYYLSRGDAGRAFRRLRKGPSQWRGLSIHYPSVRHLTACFAPDFSVVRTSAVGCLVPPTYMESWANRHPRVFRMLERMERRIETWPLAASVADHYLIELTRSRAAS